MNESFNKKIHIMSEDILQTRHISINIGSNKLANKYTKYVLILNNPYQNILIRIRIRTHKLQHPNLMR